MGSLNKLCILGVLLFSNLVFASRSATSYLGSLDDVRGATFRLEEAKARFAMAGDTEKTAKELHKMQERLYHQHATSEEEYRRSLLRLELAVARRKEATDLVELGEANLAMYKLGMEDSLGTPLTLKALHAVFVRKWKAECLVNKGSVEATEAEVRLFQYLYEVARKLYAKQAVAYEEVLLKENAYLDARERHKKNVVIGDICPKSIPTMEEIQKLFPDHT